MNNMNNMNKTSDTINLLTWKDLFTMMSRDSGGRWTANEGTPAAKYIEENGYRTPSRAWPHSHSKPLLTKKFANWLAAQEIK